MERYQDLPCSQLSVWWVPVESFTGISTTCKAPGEVRGGSVGEGDKSSFRQIKLKVNVTQPHSEN